MLVIVLLSSFWLAADASADAILNRIVQAYREDADADAWDDSWTPERLVTRGGYVASVSGDRRMAEILASLTRRRLDAGGWLNLCVAAPGYAAEYALLQTPVGEGVAASR